MQHSGKKEEVEGTREIAVRGLVPPLGPDERGSRGSPPRAAGARGACSAVGAGVRRAQPTRLRHSGPPPPAEPGPVGGRLTAMVLLPLKQIR